MLDGPQSFDRRQLDFDRLTWVEQLCRRGCQFIKGRRNQQTNRLLPTVGRLRVVKRDLPLLGKDRSHLGDLLQADQSSSADRQRTHL